MGYSIDSLPLSSFVSKQIDMPRFQRGSKWSSKQKIELAISIFKNYPLGSVIFCVEKENNQVVKNYLIDGRQRHTAIKEIYETPDLIYTWAKSYLSLSKEKDIAKAFWLKVSEYTNYDSNETSDDVQEQSINLGSDDEDAEINSNDDVDLSQDDNNLRTLLSIILMCSDGDTYNNGMMKHFDFKPYISNINKYERRLVNPAFVNKRRIDCSALKVFLYDYMREQDRTKSDYKDREKFLDYIDDTFTFINEAKRNKCRDELFGYWEEKQLKVFEIFRKIDSLLDNSKIATIVVEDVPANDEQKIFNVINTNGTPLTAAEILSAKPSWNKYIVERDIDSEIKDRIKVLYDEILDNKEGCSNGFVKWDLPASLLMSLTNFDIFFPVKNYLQKYKNKKEDKEAKIITLGFKIVSGYLTNRIKKNDLEELGNNEHINAREISDFRNKLNRMVLTINEMPYFKTFSSWALSLSMLIGDTPTIYFLLCALHMFEKLGEPNATANDAKARLFTKNCFILIDTLIFEYVNGTWKGSSDSLLESRLPKFKMMFTTEQPINHVPSDDWIKLIDEYIDSSRIKTKDISMTLTKPLITHYYCMKNIRNQLVQDFTTEFDHIIPQERFRESTEESRDKINMNNLYNIALLPKTDNASKGNKVLTDLLSNDVLKDNVVKYEEIPESRFGDFSKPQNLNKLKDFRSQMIREVYLIKRNEWIG